MISKKELMERICILEQDVDNLSSQLGKLQKARLSDKTMIDGVTQKMMKMESKLCTCKPDPDLVKKKKKFESESERRFYNAMKQPRDKSGKFIKK